MKKMFCFNCGSFDFSEMYYCKSCGRPFNGSGFEQLCPWSEMLEKEQLTVQIGIAPDGLPWVINMAGIEPYKLKENIDKVQEAVNNALRSSWVNCWPQDIAGLYEKLSEKLEKAHVINTKTN